MAGFGSSIGLLKDREFAALAGTAFARSQAYSTILIALALYADAFGTSGFVEGLFGTAFAIVQLFVVLPLGRKVDTGNAKLFLLAGFLINVGVFVGFILVQNSIHVVLVRMLQGLGASVLWITGSTIVGEISPDGERGRWLGSYNQFASFSSLAGDVVGGYLLYAHGFTTTYVVLSGVTLGAFVLVFGFLRDNPGGRKDPDEAGGVETFRDLLDLPMLRALIVFRFTFSVGKMAVIIFLPIYARTSFGISAFAIGWIMAGGKLTKALTQGFVGDLTDRLGHKHYFVAVGAILYGLGTGLIPLAAYFEGRIEPYHVSFFGDSMVLGGAFFALFSAYAVLGLADSIRLPASMALFVEEGEAYDSVASSMSLRSLSWKIGQVTGPVLVGTTMDFVSTEAGFLLAAGFIVFATGGFTVMASRARTTGTSGEPIPGD
ncbi:MFS family permease [Halalkaliarchaeum sp. AArc-CO]|uniref:MFS transporter n=1 Tax=unclassified Halalkaliarchaeum TaxID=2678344 RepID=UPI00217E61CE|nr:MULTISPECIES: MFS transporter [unclassified Halalkaliarchaeum]MDR5673266.1 MFS transporter [Halalkaliarchaeum sp. AArc-GB]UWG51774.1 MFS family permease [Halalkaliarchaeum sp. AArc-CO]